jgi:hypothetical protein
MANFFDIADNWNTVLQHEVELFDVRQAELEANLIEALQPMMDEVERQATEDFPVGALWEGDKHFKRDAHITHVGQARPRLYKRGHHEGRKLGTENLFTIPNFCVKVEFESVPSPKKGSTIVASKYVTYEFARDGRLVCRELSNLFEVGMLGGLSGSGSTVGLHKMVDNKDFSKDWARARARYRR